MGNLLVSILIFLTGSALLFAFLNQYDRIAVFGLPIIPLTLLLVYLNQKKNFFKL